MTTDGAIWVFAGPSLPPSRRPNAAAFVWRPPAMAGDAILALQAAPRAVVLIDGLFDQVPAIKHKELLALMEQGVAVIGGASMGALRAAELHTLGMLGVGRIFEAFAAGRLVGDDEVALLHGPQEMHWAPLTLPLVNVRATLARAVREAVLGVATARRLRERAAGLFFQDRTWRTLAKAWAAHGDASAAELGRFLAWASSGYVDLKQRDALECLAVAAQAAAPRSAGPLRGVTAFTERLVSQVSAGLKPDPASSARRP